MMRSGPSPSSRNSTRTPKQWQFAIRTLNLKQQRCPRLRFSLRGFFFAITAICLIGGYHLNRAREEGQAPCDLVEKGFTVTFRYYHSGWCFSPRLDDPTSAQSLLNKISGECLSEQHLDR